MQVLEVDLDRDRISLSLKATQQDPWQEFASNHRVGELVYGRVTKLVPFGAFVQVGDGIEGLVHISEMSAHHVDLPEQVVTPGEELWVKIIDLDLQRRRISLSIKQAAEGGVVAAEYQEAFGAHMYDAEGNYIGPVLRVQPRGAHRGPAGVGRVLRPAPRAGRGGRRAAHRPFPAEFAEASQPADSADGAERSEAPRWPRRPSGRRAGGGRAGSLTHAARRRHSGGRNARRRAGPPGPALRRARRRGAGRSGPGLGATLEADEPMRTASSTASVRSRTLSFW